MEREVLFANSELWAFGSLLVVGSLLILYRSNPYRIALSFKSLFSQRHLNELYYDDQVFSFRWTGVLNLLFFIIGSLLTWAYFRYGLQLPVIQATMESVFFIRVTLVFIAVKTLLYFLLGLISNHGKPFYNHIYYTSTIRSVGAIVLSPFFLCIPLITITTGHIFLLLVGIVFALGVLVRWAEGIKWLGQRDFRLLEIFLYFCTLEIIPLGILIRTYMNHL